MRRQYASNGGTGHLAFGSAVLGDVREPQCIRAVRVEAALNQIVPGRPHLAVMPPAAPTNPYRLAIRISRATRLCASEEARTSRSLWIR